MEDFDLCEICRKEQARTLPRSFDGFHQDCPRCGEFKISGTAGSILQQPLGDAKRAILSGWVKEQNTAGAVPMVSSTTLKGVLNRAPPSVVERAYRLLFEAERGQAGLGEYFNLREPRFLAATYSVKRDDLEVLIRILKEERLAQTVAIGGQCEILPRGYVKLEELRRPTSTSTQAFVAMWFEPSLLDAYDAGLQQAILQSGYDPLRIDRVEHINRIDDEIIRQIDASRFVVADLTGHRGGVYFEAGYALGRKIPIFWTCRQSDMSDLHFDIRQFNCIGWTSPEELAQRLSARINAVLGPGPRAA